MVILSNAERLEQIKNKPHLFTSHDEQCADKNWLIEQAERAERLRYVLESIVNIDGYFIGIEKEFDYETAYRMIDESARDALEETK